MLSALMLSARARRRAASNAAARLASESAAPSTRRWADSALAGSAHTLPTPCVARYGVITITDVTLAGFTAGRSRYVRDQPSVVLISATTRPTGMPRGNTPPSPDVMICVPGLSSVLNTTLRSSSRYPSPPEPACG